METNTVQTYKKSDYLLAPEIAKKYNLDPEKTYDLMLNLFKKQVRFPYVSNNIKISGVMVIKFSHSRSATGKQPLKLHPLAENIFLEKYNKRYDIAEQLNTGAQILNAGIKIAQIQTAKQAAQNTNTKEK